MALFVPGVQLNEPPVTDVALATLAVVATPGVDSGVPNVMVDPKLLQLIGLGGGFTATADGLNAAIVPTGSASASAPIMTFRRMCIFLLVPRVE